MDLKNQIQNREIKFRFYDKALSKMVYRTILPYDNEHPEIAVMQYTGLKDKNGNDIYEGDIIRGETRNFEVIFYNGMFTTDVGQYLLNGDYEKIGNIYENPELLSGSVRIINH